MNSANAFAPGSTIPAFYLGVTTGQEPTTAPPPLAASATTRRLSSTRNGKIARLSRAVREELNRRLEDGMQGKALVGWLNGLPEVKAVMDTAFDGRAVTEQNLSEWRQGGFLDWQRQQEARDWVRQTAEEAQELEQAAGPMPLTDVMGASITLLLARLIREVGEGQESTPEQRQDLILLIRQWCALRSGDHRAAKLKMQQQDWAARRARVEAPVERGWLMVDGLNPEQRPEFFVQQQPAETQVESGVLSLRSTPGGRIERLDPDPRPELSVPQRSTTHSQPSTTHSQPNRVNPAESDRIAPQKTASSRKRPKTCGKSRPRKSKGPARSSAGRKGKRTLARQTRKGGA